MNEKETIAKLISEYESKIEKGSYEVTKPFKSKIKKFLNKADMNNLQSLNFDELKSFGRLLNMIEEFQDPFNHPVSATGWLMRPSIFTSPRMTYHARGWLYINPSKKFDDYVKLFGLKSVQIYVPEEST